MWWTHYSMEKETQVGSKGKLYFTSISDSGCLKMKRLKKPK